MQGADRGLYLDLNGGYMAYAFVKVNRDLYLPFVDLIIGMLYFI